MAALIHLLSYTLIMSITPGPNNVICMAQGTAFGFRKTLPHMYGVVIGCLSQQWLILFLGSLLGDTLYSMTRVISYLGAAYILWMAWKMVTSVHGPGEGAAGHRPLTIWSSILLQYANPKAYIFNVTIITTFILPMDLTMVQNLMVSGASGLIFLLCTGTWALFGQVFNKLFHRHQKQLGYAFGAMLGYLALSILAH